MSQYAAVRKRLAEQRQQPSRKVAEEAIAALKRLRERLAKQWEDK
jgi:hypothetical protein